MTSRLIKNLGITKLAIGIVFVLVTGSTAFAMHHPEGGWRGKDAGQWGEKMKEKTDKLFEEIGLSEEQLKQIEADRKAMMEEGKAFHENLREKEKALRQVLDATETNTAEVDALVQQISDLEAQKVRHRVNRILRLKEILTPEQFAQLREEKKKEMWKEKRERRGNHRKHRGEARRQEGQED